MRVKDFMEATGASYRQMDYWARSGINLTVGDPRKGSGNFRVYDERTIERVKLLVALSTVFEGRLNSAFLKTIFDNYDVGAIALAEGISLRWDVIVNGADESPEGSASVS